MSKIKIFSLQEDKSITVSMLMCVLLFFSMISNSQTQQGIFTLCYCINCYSYTCQNSSI